MLRPILIAGLLASALATNAEATTIVVTSAAGLRAVLDRPPLQEDFADKTLALGFSFSGNGTVRDGRLFASAYRLSQQTVFTFPEDVFGFGADFAIGSTSSRNSVRASVLFADGTTGLFTLPGGPDRFFGFTADQAIRSITFTSLNGGEIAWNADNVIAGRLAPVPEPESWAMLIAGFGLIGAVSRRTRVALAVNG